MTTKTDFPVSITLKAVDQATDKLRAWSTQINSITAPFSQFGKAFSDFGKSVGLEKFGKAFSGFGGAVRNVGSELFSLGAKLVGLGVSAGLVFGALVKGAVDAGDKLGEVSDRVGLSVDSFASLQFAAAQFDVDAESFNTALDKFNQNLGDMKAGKGGEFLHFLNEISPTLARQMKAAKGTEAAFSLMTDAFAKIEDPAKRAILARHAFGKSGLQMGVFLHQGSAAIQEQQRSFMRLAGTQEAFARNAGALDNVMRETEVAFMGLRNTVLGALFPALSTVFDAVTGFIVENREGLERWAKQTAAAISAWVDGGGIQRLAATLERWGYVLGWVVEKIGGFQGVLVAVGLFMAGPLLSAFAALIPAVYSLGVALLTTPVGWIVLGLAAIALSAWYVYENWGELGAFFTKLGENLNTFASSMFEIQAGLLTLDFGRVVAGWTTGLEAFKASLLSVIKIAQFVPGWGMAVNAIDPGLERAKSMLSPETQAASEGRKRQSEARVQVDFTNLPKGARASVDPLSSADVDMSLGHAWWTP